MKPEKKIMNIQNRITDLRLRLQKMKAEKNRNESELAKVEAEINRLLNS